MLPPFPPSPPAGPPFGTCASRLKATVPSPPLPASIYILALSINCILPPLFQKKIPFQGFHYAAG